MTDRGDLVLRRVDEHFEIISNGVFLMDTRNGESERLLIDAALERCPDAETMLIGGLGVGFSLARAVTHEQLTAITVVEIEPSIIDWNGGELRTINDAAVDDPRVTIVQSDLLDLLRRAEPTYSIICLDIDNGPDWTVTDSNAELYCDAGTALAASRLAPGGVLAVWSAAASPSYEETLRRHFPRVEALQIDVPRGEPDVVYIASGV